MSVCCVFHKLGHRVTRVFLQDLDSCVPLVFFTTWTLLVFIRMTLTYLWNCSQACGRFYCQLEELSHRCTAHCVYTGEPSCVHCVQLCILVNWQTCEQCRPSSPHSSRRTMHSNVMAMVICGAHMTEVLVNETHTEI